MEVTPDEWGRETKVKSKLCLVMSLQRLYVPTPAFMAIHYLPSLYKRQIFSTSTTGTLPRSENPNMHVGRMIGVTVSHIPRMQVCLTGG